MNEIFDKIDYDNYYKWLGDSRYKHNCYVSYFDHPLSDIEMMNLEWLSFSEAKKTGFRDDFISMENSFIAFYSHLSKDGLLMNTSTGEKKVSFTVLRKYVVKMLREESLNWQWDAYFPEYNLRAVSGANFSDQLYFDNATVINDIIKLAANYDLHILETKRP